MFFDHERRMEENVFKTEKVAISGQGFYPYRNPGGPVPLVAPFVRHEPIFYLE
jgi:hypothetical protein